MTLHLQTSSSFTPSVTRNEQTVHAFKGKSNFSSRPNTSSIWQHYQNDVRHVARVMYNAYFDKCATFDEIDPHQMTCEDFLGMQATAVDSLDTLILLDLSDEYEKTRKHLQTHLKFSRLSKPTSVFETSIRILGGLNSAYALSGDILWKQKAQVLASRILPLFNETPSKCPEPNAELHSFFGESKSRSKRWRNEHRYTTPAEAGTLQLEMRTVSRFTGDPEFARAVDTCTDTLIAALDKLPKDRGKLPPPSFDLDTSEYSGTTQTLSGPVDSFVEMLLKTWISSAKSSNDSHLIRTFNTIARHAWTHLVKKSPTGITYLGHRLSDKDELETEMHHLACFYPGTLALAALHGLGGGLNASSNSEVSANAPFLVQARQLAEACWEMTRIGPLGMASETTVFGTNGPSAKEDIDFTWLRPEIVEALFYLDAIDPIGGDRYKQWGRLMWDSLRANAQVPGRPDGLLGSWKGLRLDTDSDIDVESSDMDLSTQDQRMSEMDDGSTNHSRKDGLETGRQSSGRRQYGPALRPDGKLHSFVIAETLKYFYLLFDERKGEDAPLPLTKWVFNTEAHPVPIQHAFERSSIPGSLDIVSS